MLETSLEDVPGVLGVAADLVSAPAEIAPVVTALLGRTLVADNLVTARAALQHLPRAGASSPSPGRSPTPVVR